MKTVTVQVNGVAVTVPEGACVLAAVASLTDVLHPSVRGEPRGAFCGMGQCQACRVSIDGRPMLACLTRARSGAVITLDAHPL